MNESPVLDRDAHPYVLGPGEPWGELSHPLVTLREDLIHVVIGARHHIEHALHVLVGDVLVEHVAHRVHEDDARLLPLERVVEPARPEPQIEPLLIRVVRDPTPPLGERLGVAVGAARRHLGASRNGVPGRFRPLDGARARHSPPPSCPQFAREPNRCSHRLRTDHEMATLEARPRHTEYASNQGTSGRRRFVRIFVNSGTSAFSMGRRGVHDAVGETPIVEWDAIARLRFHERDDRLDDRRRHSYGRQGARPVSRCGTIGLPRTRSSAQQLGVRPCGDLQIAGQNCGPTKPSVVVNCSA